MKSETDGHPIDEPDLIELLAATVIAAKSAGALLEAEWNREGGPRGRGGSAEVDVEIEELLRETLLALFPTDFWGEETGHVITGNSYCWVVDPNDGTSDFLKGLKGSAVSIGLVKNRVPVLGVVYASVTEALGPDCISWSEGLPWVLHNGVPPHGSLNRRYLAETDHNMVSAAAAGRRRINAELCAPAQFIAMLSIAYRLARVAAGDGVWAVSLYPVSAHDVVSGHALLQAAGGTLVNENGKEVCYDTSDQILTVAVLCFGGYSAAADALFSRGWQQLTSRVFN